MNKLTKFLPARDKEQTAFLSRRAMLRLCAVAPTCAGFGSLLFRGGVAKAMIFLPKQAIMWDTWILYYHDTFYLFYLSQELNSPDSRWTGYSLATSTDGIHWSEKGCVYRDPRGIGSGYVYQSPSFHRDGKFLMQITRSGNRALSFAESTDLLHWTELGEKFDFSRDLRWYSPDGRWDMMHVIERPGGGCYGYWTADPIGAVGFGFGESDDGIRWKALPPPVIDWGEVDVPMSKYIEVTSVDKIGDRYYALLHTLGYMGDGNGAYVLVADNPAGPFRADAKAYRFFSTNSGPDLSGMWCCTCCHTPSGVLVTNHQITHAGGKDHANHGAVWLPSDARIFHAPLKRAIVGDDEGHLRLGYWEGNDKLRVKALPIEMDVSQSTGTAKWESIPDGVQVAGAPRISEMLPQQDYRFVPKFSILLFQSKFDFSKGIILEGTMTIPSRLNYWLGAAGIFIEEEGGTQGTAILNQTINSATGQTKGLLCIGVIGKQDMESWDPDDKVNTGINVSKGKFRLLLRDSLLEFYIDDLLARSYSLPERTYSGRLGLVVSEADARFEDLRAWSMELR